jgi:hypothetical protein
MNGVANNANTLPSGIAEKMTPMPRALSAFGNQRPNRL